MSLRTEFLEELNTLAKRRDVEALTAKMREVMVHRHPATLSPEEQDPVTTVALAWKESAAARRSTFEAAILGVISSMERARIEDVPSDCDWPLSHAVLKLLQMLAPELVSDDTRKRIVRTLSGSVSEREVVLKMLDGIYPAASALWIDAFRLYLLWHLSQPAWLDTIWRRALSDEDWPINDAAIVFMEDAARRHPAFITVDHLALFWKSALGRKASLQDLKRWFYVIGASLEETAEGKAVLIGLYDQFGAHLQDHRLGQPSLPWDHFVEAAAAAFRNPDKNNHILSLKAPAKTPASVREHHEQIPQQYKADSHTIPSSLTSSLLGNGGTRKAAA